MEGEAVHPVALVRDYGISVLGKAERAWIGSEPAAGVRVGFGAVLRHRAAWAYMAGRFLIDPVWWTFLFWLPDFFAKQCGIDLKGFGPALVAIYLLADIGAIAGGWYSSRLLTQGRAPGLARRRAMLACAVFALPAMGAAQAGTIGWAVAAIGLACAAHQGFSTNLFATPGDLSPPRAGNADRAGRVRGGGGGLHRVQDARAAA